MVYFMEKPELKMDEFGWKKHTYFWFNTFRFHPPFSVSVIGYLGLLKKYRWYKVGPLRSLQVEAYNFYK